MNKKPSLTASNHATIESLESRTFLSAASTPVESPAYGQHDVIVSAAKGVKLAATKTLLTISTGTLSAPVTYDVMVRAAATAGTPTGTVNLVNHGTVFQTLTLIPTSSSDPKFAFSHANLTVPQQPGGSAFYFGKHPIKAFFVPTGNFKKSSGGKAIVVPKPNYTFLSTGVAIATVTPGSGTPIQTNQLATGLYTGYLVKGGHIFDDSALHGGGPFQFTLGGGHVIAGFDAGVAGMQVGETRIIYMPPSLGYGAAGSPPAVPPNATLIFVFTLTLIT